MIYERLVAHGQNYPEAKAVIGERGTLKYQDLIKAVDRAAEGMKAAGISRNTPVILYLSNSPEFLISFLAVMKLGGTAIPVDLRWKQELRRIIAGLQEPFIISNHRNQDGIISWVQPETPIAGFGLIEEYQAGGGNIHFGQKFLRTGRELSRREGIALILFSSGSLGKPKAVGLTASNLLNWALNYTETLGIRAGEVVGGFVPYYHSYGFGSCFLAAIYAGATLVPLEQFSPRKMVAIIHETGVNLCHCVPYMYDLLLQGTRKRLEFPTVRYFVSAGAPLSLETGRLFYQKTGQVIHQEYGSTESCTVAINLEKDPEFNGLSVGQPLRNVKVEIRDETGLPVPAGLEGGIFVKSKAKAAWIADPETGDLRREPEEWFGMGDIGRLDRGGWIYITGRAKRMVNVAGVKVSPEEIEQMLKNHPKVLDAAVIGVSNPIYGEIIAAFIVACWREEWPPSETAPRAIGELGEEELFNELSAWCQENLAPYKVPKYFLLRKELPKSPLGKIKYEELAGAPELTRVKRP